MSNTLTPTEFAKLFTHAYMRMNYDTFVEYVLNSQPRDGDAWQDEKFELFQQTGRRLARLSPEHIEAIIDFALKHGS